MFSIQPKKSKRGIRINVSHDDDRIGRGVREMFIGHHTIFSLIGLAIGGTLVGKTLWEWLAHTVGLPITLVIGLFVFAISGLALHTFDDDRFRSSQEDIIQEIIES